MNLTRPQCVQVEEKDKAEHQRLARLQRRLVLEQKDKELALRDSILVKEAAASAALQTAAWRKHHATVAMYIKTKAEPPILWLPASYVASLARLSDRFY